MIGRTLGHYVILELLGAGGVGDVYRAHDTTLKRDVAIKVLPEDLSADVGRLARLEREAQLLAALNHPNIEVIHGLEEHGPHIPGGGHGPRQLTSCLLFHGGPPGRFPSQIAQPELMRLRRWDVTQSFL